MAGRSQGPCLASHSLAQHTAHGVKPPRAAQGRCSQQQPKHPSRPGSPHARACLSKGIGSGLAAALRGCLGHGLRGGGAVATGNGLRESIRSRLRVCGGAKRRGGLRPDREPCRPGASPTQRVSQGSYFPPSGSKGARRWRTQRHRYGAHSLPDAWAWEAACATACPLPEAIAFAVAVAVAEEFARSFLDAGSAMAQGGSRTWRDQTPSRHAISRPSTCA